MKAIIVIKSTLICIMRAWKENVFSLHAIGLIIQITMFCLLIEYNAFEKAIAHIKNRKVKKKRFLLDLAYTQLICYLHPLVQCLCKSLVLCNCLRDHVNTVVYCIGVKRFGSRIIAHAWLIVDNEVVDSTNYYVGYTPIRRIKIK